MVRIFFSSRRRHTRSLCDWSSDVCSSDLINADAFGANQSYHLLDLLLDWRRDVSEKQMRFVEEENQLRFFRVANFRKILERSEERRVGKECRSRWEP